MATVYPNATWVAAEIVSDSAEFKALGARMLAMVKAEALKHNKTGEFLGSIKAERTAVRGDLRPFTSRVRDWIVYSDDKAAVIIEFGGMYKRGGKTIVQAPNHVFSRAVGRR